jgi:hypothetical protein
MRHMHFIVILSLIGPAVAVRADDALEPFGALTGSWMRPSWVVATKDGKDFVVPAPVTTKDGNIVTPGLSVFIDGKTWKLAVGGTPPTVYWNPGPTVYDLVIPQGAKKGVLAIGVPDRGLKRQVRFEYTLEKDTLTIRCKEKVAAGPWLGDYDISGRWVRVRPKLGYFE